MKKSRAEELTKENFLEQVTKFNQKSDLKKISEAYDFAFEAHSGQKRESGEDFFLHSRECASFVASFKIGTDAVCAALLHDVLEDTDTKPETIQRIFGAEVCRLVQSVTKEVSGTAIQDKRAENLRKILPGNSQRCQGHSDKNSRQAPQHENPEAPPGNETERNSKRNTGNLRPHSIQAGHEPDQIRVRRPGPQTPPAGNIPAAQEKNDEEKRAERKAGPQNQKSNPQSAGRSRNKRESLRKSQKLLQHIQKNDKEKPEIRRDKRPLSVQNRDRQQRKLL